MRVKSHNVIIVMTPQRLMWRIQQVLNSDVMLLLL